MTENTKNSLCEESGVDEVDEDGEIQMEEYESDGTGEHFAYENMGNELISNGVMEKVM